MNPEQLTSTPTIQDLLNEEIQKLAVKTHLEVQQREDIRRDLAERMTFVLPDLRVGEKCVLLARRSEQISARSEVWKMVEGWRLLLSKVPSWLSVLVRHFSS